MFQHTINPLASLSCILCLAVWFNHCEAADQDRLPNRKKGFCINPREDDLWQKKVEALNISWFYSWGVNAPKVLPAGVEFVPMTWGRFVPENSQAMAKLTNLARRGEFKYLMGFNEPDQYKQADLSVAEAIKLWPKLEAIGLPLCSPGCVHPDRQWMKEFMQEVENKSLRVDYVCVHSYGGPNAQTLVNRLRKIRELYGRPLWITEFAVGDWQAKTVAENKHSPEKVAKFMRDVLPMLEELDFVHRYSWFSAAPNSAPLGTSALFHKDGSLTELGKIYSSF